MAKISFDTQVNNTPSAANKKQLLADGIYTAMVTRYEKIVKDGKMGIKLHFGVLDPSQGITHIVHSYLAIGKLNKETAKAYARSSCQTLINCLNIPNIFDDEEGISQSDIKHILFKKIMIAVVKGEGEDKTNGNKWPINKIEGYAPYGLAKPDNIQEEHVAPKPIEPLPGTAHCNTLETVPDHLIEEDSFSSIVAY